MCESHDKYMTRKRYVYAHVVVGGENLAIPTQPAIPYLAGHHTHIDVCNANTRPHSTNMPTNILLYFTSSKLMFIYRRICLLQLSCNNHGCRFCG